MKGGTITESVWYQLAELMVQRTHKEALFNHLLQFETETTHNSCFDFKKLRPIPSYFTLTASLMRQDG